jgi:hypothetical protein
MIYCQLSDHNLGWANKLHILIQESDSPPLEVLLQHQGSATIKQWKQVYINQCTDNNSTMLSFYTIVLWVSNLTRVSKGVYVQVKFSQCRWYHILQPTWYLHLDHCKILWYSPIHLHILCQVTNLGFHSIHLFNAVWKKMISTQHCYTTTGKWRRIWTIFLLA